MGATIIKLKPAKKDLKEGALTPFQKKLLNFPVMSTEEYKEFKKNEKWIKKWKV